MKKVILSALFLTTMIAEAQQSFAGLRESSYSGIYQATANPAYMISNKRNWDANIVSVNAGFSNNAIKLVSTDFTKQFNDYTRLDANNTLLAQNDINARINVDVLGPSLFLKINDQHSVGFFSRARVLGNLNNVDAKMLQTYISDFEKMELRNNYSIDLNNQEVVLNAFSEVGFSWAGELYFDGHNAFKAGATIKYVMGAANLYAGFRDFNGTASLTTDTNTRKVMLNIQSNNGVFEVMNGGSDLISNFNAGDLLASKASTVGFDLGFVYEYRKDGCRDCHNRPHDLRIGLSIMDIGRIKYTTNKESYTYRMPNSGPVSFDLDDISEETLKNAGFKTEKAIGRNVRSSLPTTFNLSADYRVIDGFYVNAATQLNITSKSNSDLYNARYANEFSITPRFDTNSFGAYLPISYNQISKMNLGLALRLGPLVLGSSTFIGNFVTKSAKEINFFVGLRFGHKAYPIEI